MLDIGSGTSRWTKLMAKNFKKVVGIDISPKMIEISRQKNYAPNITYRQVNMFKLKTIFKNKKFNIITALMAVQYVKDSRELLKLFQNIYNLLNSTGHFIFLVPHPIGITVNKSKWIKFFFKKNVSYFDNFTFQSKLLLTDNSWKKVCDYFHSFGEYLNCAAEAGFRIMKIYEPKPTPALIAKYPDMKNDARWPTCLIVKAQKE